MKKSITMLEVKKKKTSQRNGHLEISYKWIRPRENGHFVCVREMSHDMRFPTMWYVRPANLINS